MNPASPSSSVLAPELETRTRQELLPGERLVWIGQPLVWRMRRRGWPGLIGGGIFLFGGVFWLLNTTDFFDRGNAGGFDHAIRTIFSLFGLAPLVIGLGVTVLPWLYARAARRTIYALTDRRVLVWEATLLGPTRVLCYGPDRVARMRRLEHADGSGDLVFEVIETRDSEGDVQTTERGFIAVPEVRNVETLVRQTLAPSPRADD